MGLSATSTAAAQDLSGMLSASNAAAADKAQGASSSGADTFGSMLSDRLQSDRATQEAARRRTDAQSTDDDATSHRVDIARKAAAHNSQDNQPADGNAKAQAATTPAIGTDTASAKPAQSAKAKDLDEAAQAVIDPAAQLAAQIEAARQAAQQAGQQTAAATSVSQLPAAQSNAGANSNATADGAAQAIGTSAAADAATLAALNAATNGAQAAQTAQTAQTAQAALQAAKDTKTVAGTARAVDSANAQTPPVTPAPDGASLVQTLARTRAMGDNTPSAVRQLGSAASPQSTSGEHGFARRTDQSTHSNVTQTAAAAVSDAASRANDGSNAGMQADAQGAGAQFQGILARANGDASNAAPTFAIGTAGATGAAAGASMAPAQVHTLPTFGDAAWPHSMASQLAFMQVHRQSSAELQLNPAELGGLQVKLDVDNGAVNASFVCQHQAVAELVQDAMPRLRDAMQQGGMQLAQTSVSTGDFSQQQSASQGSSAQGNGSGAGGSGSRFGGGGSQGRADVGTVAAAPQRVSSHDGAIDMFA